MTPSTLLFNPSRLDTDELESTFVGRRALMERLEQDLIRDAATHTARHWLLIGLRGLGKSHLVELLSRRLRRHHGWSVARIPEEHYQIASLADLLEQIVMQVTDGLSPFADEPDPRRVELRAIDTLRQRQGVLLVVVENLGSLLYKLPRRDLHRLRELLMRDAPFTLVATAPGPVEATTDHDAPFYDFFQTLVLDELTRDEVRELVATRMQRDGARELLDREEENLGRFDALYHFAGGNPRLALALYGVLREGATDVFHGQMLELLDRITPYYQARLSDVSDQMARVLTEMALASGPLTPAEIARRARLKTNQVTANISKLVDERLIRAAGRPDKRRRYYEVVDRLFRIWLQMREERSSRQRFRFLADFYEVVYSGRRDAAWQLAEHLRKQYWRGATGGKISLAREAVRTLSHLGPALGLGDEVVRVVLEGEPPTVKEAELVVLERQLAEMESIEEKQATALRLVEGWDQLGWAERAFPSLSRVVSAGPVPWRTGCWYSSLAAELGAEQQITATLTADDHVKDILSALFDGGGRAFVLFAARAAELDLREQRALFRLLAALNPGTVLDAVRRGPTAAMGPTHSFIVQQILALYPQGLPIGGLPNVALWMDADGDRSWRIVRQMLRRGFLGVGAVYAVFAHLNASVDTRLKDEITAFLLEEVPDWPLLRWVLERARSPEELGPYAHLRRAGYLAVAIPPLEAALQVRDAPDRVAALAALHPEEREAVQILLDGLARG